MSKSNEHTVTTEIEAQDGAVYQVKFLREVELSHDRNYGADADGRHGVGATFIETDRAVDIHLFQTGNYVPLLELPDTLRLTVEELVSRWLEENEPDTESLEPYHLGPDPEDIGR